MENVNSVDKDQDQLKNKKGRKKRGRFKKIFFATTLLLVGVILLTIIIAAIGNSIIAKSLPKYSQSFDQVKYEEGAQLIPTKDADGYWTFETDRPFKVVQLTDIHIGGGLFSTSTDKRVINAIAAMVTAEKPDLVIATGDIAYPVPFSAGTANNKQAASVFATLMEKLGVYWTITFGNHDTESYSKYNREQMSSFYASKDFKYSLYQEGPADIKGCGNSIIKVKNTKGFITRAIVTLDSHAYLPGDKLGIKWDYDNMHENQENWYKSEMRKMHAANEEKFDALPDADKLNDDFIKLKKVPSSLYFHIPLKEYKDAWVEFAKNNNQDIAGKVELVYGRVGETGRLIYHGVGSDNMFDAMLEVGGDSTFCGHDHYNNISINYWKGDATAPIRLTYGLSLDYLAYVGIAGKGSQRGCTVIEYDGIKLDVTPENYYQEKYTSIAKYKVESVKIVENEVPKKK